jgi:uncharacterized protein YggE
VGVETRQENLGEATRQNDQRVANVLHFLKTSGLKDKDVQTDFISVEPMYKDNISWIQPMAYLARKSIEMRLTNVASFEGVLKGLLTNGVNQVHGIEFRTSQLRKHRDQARKLAIQAAKEKAEALAVECGVKCGRVYTINANDGGGSWSISGGYGGGPRGYMAQNTIQNFGGVSDMTGDTFSVGQISVTASVNVVFLLE